MRTVRFILLFLFNLLIDLTVLSRFNINGYIPSITIPLIIILAMYNEKENIHYYAIFQGLFQDVVFAGILGIKALFYYLISYYAQKFDTKKNFSILYAILVLFVSVLIKNLLLLARNIYQMNVDISDLIKTYIYKVPTELIISTIILIVFYFIASFLIKTKIREYI